MFLTSLSSLFHSYFGLSVRFNRLRSMNLDIVGILPFISTKDLRNSEVIFFWLILISNCLLRADISHIVRIEEINLLAKQEPIQTEKVSLEQPNKIQKYSTLTHTRNIFE
jgi:hypothetical protein